MLPNLSIHNLVLGSASPRRQALLKDAGFDFELITADIEENFSDDLKAHEIPLFLSKLKANHLIKNLPDNKILITADTIVWYDNKALNKPVDFSDAVRMLKELSGQKHEVFTGVCITSHQKQVSFFVRTVVTFKSLSDEEIEFYVSNYKPFDKAGAYGAQDWIGLVAVEKIDGSYFNVMGLPVKELFEHLKAF
ncbi:MAG TPA: Maf family nucleotide pyrophosphatase [Bacteroidia bacterium]|nr:Maf family nucleotide pyrophosphatase [Bacteroidia bacterium]